MTTDTTATVSPLGKILQSKVDEIAAQHNAQMAYIQSQALTSTVHGGITGTALYNHNIAASQSHSRVRDAEHYTNSVDIKGAVYETSIDALDALWLVMYGNEWVTDVRFDDKFWEVAAERLNQMGRLEKHYLTDRACYVYRIPK